ncbi:piwi domain-containing protein [Hirsutella rhossiliensis]|uniref:Piwi domain-containing protein n=1 Tax=Hirsutella rhossiliensis TaxID=111463 RepID=A0A9P8MUZ8_9HYPO|nr:piwi domain-containing protein [Hirsutella rhossiliensis]KAH0962608.1 piwi domain-containing protein [Hirsutella rhossiliensis]
MADRGGRGGRGRGGDRGGYSDRGGRGGYRGRGDGYRGGGFRGGRGGRPRDTTTELAYNVNGSFPPPDPAVTALEDRLIKTQASSAAGLAAQMAKANIQAAPLQARSTDVFPLRPAFGTNGQPVTLWSNYFNVNFKPMVLYKYTFEFVQVGSETSSGEPSQSAKAASREVKGRKLYFAVRELLATLKAADKTLVLATEYKSQLVSLQKLKLAENPLRFRLAVETSGDNWDVIEATIHGPTEAPLDALLKYVGSMSEGPVDGLFPKYPDVVDALNVVLGHGPRSKLHDISAVGSARFFPFGRDEAATDLFQDWHQLIAARGFFQSARLGTGRLLLNANVSHGVFRAAGRLADLFDRFQIRPTQAFDNQAMRKIKAFAKFMPKTRVWAEITLSTGEAKPADGKPLKFAPNYEYPGPKQVQFFLNDGKGGGQYISVFDYFKMKYKKTLKDYPLVNLGRSDKPTLFPAEVIEIQPGQSVKARLTMNETTAMLDVACRSPYSNATSISADGRKTLGLDDNGLRPFGISVDKSLLTVRGRVLNVPMISYLNNQQKRSDVSPFNGSWNMRNVRVVKAGAMIERWTFLNVMKRSDSPIIEVSAMKDFAKFLGSNMGIRIKDSPQVPGDGKMFTSWERAMGDGLENFFTWAKNSRIQYVFFVLTEKDSQGLYSKIKSLGDCTFGIHTSVVTSKHLLKPNNFIFYANVGLKVNLKAGGVNHRLREDVGLLKEGKTMVAGYDVTHPTNMTTARDACEAPSLVGLVASIDKDLAQWPACSWEQPSKQEMLSAHLVDAFKSRLELWQKHNQGALPDNIVIFRDGVSEGQFSQVLELELPSIRQACRAKYPAKASPPRLTIVVSVKRHQTRFFPTSSDVMSDSGNIRNGTVVDRGVTQARYWDFFLTAHHALKGTARPAHYTVILDEIFRQKYKATAANELERLTHELCYLYGRATKAVSICPPAYYADIVCERARAHRPEIFEASDTDSVSTTGKTAPAASRQVHETLQDTMYYI